ncbi:glycosyltransferase family 2 protein [uncultured Christiangramia sp.]|uniref:glycosyltransferase family 2 protein n=1 Tax=uncultured Christiangramia sp. TaxID=503836 RepID=UPI002634CC05|nr:glycosyltransferase family 2 protein [uncultured Christiangramia sp.]
MIKVAKPDVSIIMATYNRAHLIVESLISIQNQTFENWECIIIDDGSTDETSAQLKPYLSDSRFRYLTRSAKHKKGLPGCRNYGIGLAKGDYIIFFDDDDIAHPQNLEICVKELKTSKADFCHYKKRSFTTVIPILEKNYTSKGRYKIGIDQIEQVVTNRIALASCTVLWNKKCFKNVRFDESLQYAEEWECYIRILVNGFSGIGIKSTLYFNRKHSNSNTGEFWSGKKIRRDSKIKAIKKVIDNLIKEQYLSKTLLRYFIQMGIFLKEFSIVKYALQESNSSLIPKIKYYSLYYFYPIVGRLYRLKKTLLNNG